MFLLLTSFAPFTEYQESCSQAGVNVAPLTLTIPSGASATGSSGSSPTSRVSVTFDTALPTQITISGGGSTPTSGSGSTETTGGVSDPLATDGAARNGAGLVVVSSSAVVGAAALAMSVLSL